MSTTHNVLYVDDEGDNLVVFASRFKRVFNVFTATSAADGLALMSRNDIHVVISDQRMPEMSGIQFLEKVRDSYPDAIRILLTAYTESADLIDAINKGAVYYFMKKPWVGEALQQQIEKCLVHFDVRRRRRQAMEDLYRSAETASSMVHRIPPELQELLKKQQQLVGAAIAETDKSKIQNHLVAIKDALTRMTEIVSASESEYNDLKALTEGETGLNFMDHGLIDEDLANVMQRFPDVKGRLHRLHSLSAEFRQLCQDYYECIKVISSVGKKDEQSILSIEYRALKAELEGEILSYVDRMA